MWAKVVHTGVEWATDGTGPPGGCITTGNACTRALGDIHAGISEGGIDVAVDSAAAVVVVVVALSRLQAIGCVTVSGS